MNQPVALGRIAASGAVWLLIFVSVVSWRKGVIYAGGVDPVVLTKAGIAALAACVAFVLWRTAPTRRVISPFPILLVGAIVGISLLGATAAGTADVDAVLGVRIVLLMVTVVLLLTVQPSVVSITLMLTAMTAVALVSAGSGYASAVLTGGGGRLEGGVPPLESNELAAMLLPGAIALVAVIVRRGLLPLPLIGLTTLSWLIFATGSRTALAMLGVGALVSLLVVRRLTRGMLVLGVIALVGLYIVIGFSNTVSDLALRGEGIDRLLTLNSRTISWAEVLATPITTWTWWIGDGLSVKSIEVHGQFWQTQVFDSSWISSLAQDGVIGTVLLVVYVIGTVVAAGGRRGTHDVALPILVTLTLRSVVENGLIESSTAFVVFFTLALAVWPGTSDELRPRAVEPERWAFLRTTKVLVRPGA